jgi:hypothetical protein
MRLRIFELDPDPDPRMRGISLMIDRPRASGEDDPKPDTSSGDGGRSPIRNLEMENVSAWDLLHLIARETGREVEITDTGIVIGPR